MQGNDKDQDKRNSKDKDDKKARKDKKDKKDSNNNNNNDSNKNSSKRKLSKSELSEERKRELTTDVEFVRNVLDKNEQAGDWASLIPWFANVKDAKELAVADNVPLFVEVSVDGPGGKGTVCLGSRIFRCSLLSDPRVIERITAEFVPYALNVTHDGFPLEELPALKTLKRIYKSCDRFKKGFASVQIIDPSGKHILASYSPMQPNMEKVCSFEEFSKVLDSAFKRWKKHQEIEQKFKGGNILSGIGGMAKISMEDVTKLKQGLEGAWEVWRRLKAAGYTEEDIMELATHGNGIGTSVDAKSQ